MNCIVQIKIFDQNSSKLISFRILHKDSRTATNHFKSNSILFPQKVDVDGSIYNFGTKFCKGKKEQIYTYSVIYRTLHPPSSLIRNHKVSLEPWVVSKVASKYYPVIYYLTFLQCSGSFSFLILHPLNLSVTSQTNFRLGHPTHYSASSDVRK